MTSVEDVVKRLDIRPGHTVVAYREVGLPVFLITCLLTLQEEKDIGPIHEFVLRAIEAGVSEAYEISQFLGLPTNIVKHQLAGFVMDRTVTGPNDNRYALSAKGRAEVAEAKRRKVSQDHVPIYIDGLTRNVIHLEQAALYREIDIRSQGLSLASPMPQRPPKATEINTDQINEVFAILAGRSKPLRRALRIDATLGRTSLYYQHAICIAFKSDTKGGITLGFALDGRLSDDHEIAVARNPQNMRSKLFGPILDSKKRRREVQAVRKHVRTSIPDVSSALDNAPPGLGGQAANVRELHVYEHASILRNSFETATSRLLLISPWIRGNVVDKAFVERLIQCLDRNVNVTFVYGLGRRDLNEKDTDAAARSSLEGLASSFANFRLIRRGNTHAKVLLVDSTFYVVTSFNWLSFKGDPKQPFREEWGMYVEGKNAVDTYHSKLIESLRQQNVHNS